MLRVARGPVTCTFTGSDAFGMQFRGAFAILLTFEEIVLKYLSVLAECDSTIVGSQETA